MNSVKIIFLILFLTIPVLSLTKTDTTAAIHHPMIKPMPGFELEPSISEKSDFSTYTFRIKNGNDTENIEKKGRFWKLHYYKKNEKGKIDNSVSKVEITENYKAAAIELGGEVLYEIRGKITFTVPLNNGAKLWCFVVAQNGSYDLNIIEVEGFKKQLTFDADEMMRILDSAGTISIYGINFDFNKADLQVGAEKILSEIVELMKKNPGLNIEIQGHTDNTGTKDYNLSLSNKRAESVKNYLTLFGITSSKMSAKGYGMSRPIATNDTEEGRATNRRVELVKLN